MVHFTPFTLEPSISLTRKGWVFSVLLRGHVLRERGVGAAGSVLQCPVPASPAALPGVLPEPAVPAVLLAAVVPGHPLV